MLISVPVRALGAAGGSAAILVNLSHKLRPVVYFINAPMFTHPMQRARRCSSIMS